MRRYPNAEDVGHVLDIISEGQPMTTTQVVDAAKARHVARAHTLTALRTLILRREVIKTPQGWRLYRRCRA